MDNAGPFFLCSCCGTQFPSALLLSQHCATHHQGFELSPFISVGSMLPTGQGTLPQAPPNHYDIINQPPITRKPSGHDITLTQLQTVNPSSQAHLMPSPHPLPQQEVVKHGKGGQLPVLSSNTTTAKFGSGYFAMSEAIHSTQSQEGTETRGNTQYTCVVNPTQTLEAHSNRNLNNPSGMDGNLSMQITNQIENQLQPIVKTPTTENGAGIMQTHVGGVTTVAGTLSVIQSNHCSPTGQRDNINNDNSHIQKQISHRVTKTVLTSMVSMKNNLGWTNQTEASYRLPSSTLAVLPLHQQQTVLLARTPAFPMGVLTAVGVPQTEPVIKPTKPPRGQGPRPFSCPTCEKTFTLKYNLQQHEVYAHSDDRPYACSKCDNAFKLKGHLKEHERNSHSEERPFKCTQCEKTFKQKSHLTGHMSIHDGSKPHRCETCGLVFRQKQHLKRHALTHTGKRLFSCSHCPSTFNISSDLKRHTRIHTGERPFCCAHCGKGFARKQAVRIHEKIHFKPFICQRCSKSFRDLQALADHEKKHVKSLSHDCRECDQRFSLFTELKEHMKIHKEKSKVVKEKKIANRKNMAARPNLRMTRQRTAAARASHRKTKPKSLRPKRREQDSNEISKLTDDEQLSCSVCRRPCRRCNLLRHEQKCHGIQHTVHQCEECEETFTGRNTLMAHAKEHKNPERFRCDRCDEAFQYESHLHKHLVSAHGVKPFSCDICSKTFVQKKSYLEHSRTCKKEDTVSCELCKDVFKQKVSLLRHKVKAHGLRPYSCTICERGFANKGTLQRHIVTHSSDRPHQCQYCSKTFKEKRQVDQHEKTHRGERPFQCFQCGLSFHRKAYLERHEAIHTGEKRFRCPHCPTAFFMGHDLKRHLRIHTGEKPFACKICKKAFRRKAAVAFHEKQVHMRKFQCSYCSRKFFTKSQLDSHTVMHLGVPRPQIPVENCDPCHRTGDAEGVPSAPIRMNSKASGLAPSLDSADAPTMQHPAMAALTPIIGATTSSCELQEGSDSDDLPCLASDLPPNQSSTSGPDSSRAQTDPSDATDVTFFLCNSCGSLFPSAAMLARHTQLLHNPSLTINNPAPKAKSTTRQRTKRESRSKMKKKDTPNAMDGTVKQQMCAECGEEYMGDSKAHGCLDASNVPVSPGPEVIEDPGPDYVDQYPVRTVGESKEKDESLYYCRHCDKGFKKMSSHNVHQRIHTGDKPFVCKFCNKAFSVKSNLKQHEIAKHTDERPYACSKCDARFKQHSHLKSHEEIHAGIKNYECTVCDQKFRQSSHLQRHKLIHDGIKQYKCERCPSAFNLVSDLQRHSLIHSGVKPFQCDQCEKRFRRKFQLKVHQQMHTGELPLQCPHCRKAFMDKKCFESHVSAHEGKALHKCDACDKSFSTEYVLKRHSCGQKTVGCFKCEQCSKSFKCKDTFDNHKCRGRTGRTEKKECSS
ncbi:zinc finger protein 850 [Strongylocentrotus purpuratus]|uniref:C2H2-type domain-containing protein n=1 Tax=Strongylocentrotus purpuratus TaxID=7668 RepID=A0A7M7LPC2_STRPU|nr:zinc finger protein 850 [Strongylocentrotus purpuratus]